jgi:uncharacterized membrane protein YgcG
MNLFSLVLVAGFAAALVPAAARADDLPSYAHHDETIHGTIISFDGKYTAYVRDERGFVDRVRLHDGTVINPTGLTLEPGQSVTILGRTDGRDFDANEIDTPYQDDGDYAPDPGAAYVAPYDYYPSYPAYALAYPAFVSLGFGFGYFGGYGGYYHPGYYGGYGHYGYGYGYAPYPHGGYYGYYGHSGYYAHGGSYSSTTPYGRFTQPVGRSFQGSRPLSSGAFRGSSAGSFHGSSAGGFHGGGGGFHGGGGGHH